MTFLGTRRTEAVGHAHDGPAAMTWTLVALAVPTTLLGFTGLADSWLPRWLPGAEPGVAPSVLPGLVTSLISIVAIVAVAWQLYRRWAQNPSRDLADTVLGRYRPFIEDGFGIDRLYDRVFVRPTFALARLFRSADDDVVDAYVRGSGAGARMLGGVLRRAQTGNVQTYLTGILVGSLVIGLSVAAVAR